MNVRLKQRLFFLLFFSGTIYLLYLSGSIAQCKSGGGVADLHLNWCVFFSSFYCSFDDKFT